MASFRSSTATSFKPEGHEAVRLTREDIQHLKKAFDRGVRLACIDVHTRRASSAIRAQLSLGRAKRADDAYEYERHDVLQDADRRALEAYLAAAEPEYRAQVEKNTGGLWPAQGA